MNADTSRPEILRQRRNIAGVLAIKPLASDPPFWYKSWFRR